MTRLPQHALQSCNVGETNHADRLRVLFVHGLESGPQGKKARALREAGFEVVAEAMPCSQRSMLREPLTIALFSLATLLMIVGIRLGVFGALVAALALLVSTPFGVRLIIARAFQKSIQVQRDAISQHAIDVVLGSSYGGAVALELLCLGVWKGPTVLLCPAHELVAKRIGRPRIAITLRKNVCVVHGTRDETVPIENARALVQASEATLLEVDDDHRLSKSATPENLATWIRIARGEH